MCQEYYFSKALIKLAKYITEAQDLYFFLPYYKVTVQKLHYLSAVKEM